MASILLIISGSVAAYKSLDVIRRLREREHEVRCILTKGGAQFITPLQVSSLSGTETYSELFSLKDEVEMGHIRLSREADLILVCPASADMLAKMATGRADDLASACLLASDKPAMAAPAMNVQMWRHPATCRNLEQLRADGVRIIGPEAGSLACGEVGDGRLASLESILAAVETAVNSNRPLSGLHALVTAGPTYEPLDPVRFIGNRSSGKQGYAIVEALAAMGARVTLVSGPTALPDPAGCTTLHVETAEQMWQAVQSALPADIAVCSAAVADWRPTQPAGQKMKKRAAGEPPTLSLQQTTDILGTLGYHAQRPALLIGFAAETENLEAYARRKREEKHCDWIVANEVGEGKIFGKDTTSAMLITEQGIATRWDSVTKRALAEGLIARIVTHFHEQPKLVTTRRC